MPDPTLTHSNPTIDKSLRARRAKRGSLRGIARLANIDAGQLSKAERGQGSLSVESLYRLAVVLNLRQLARQLEDLHLVRPAARIGSDREQSDTTTASGDAA